PSVPRLDASPEGGGPIAGSVRDSSCGGPGKTRFVPLQQPADVAGRDDSGQLPSVDHQRATLAAALRSSEQGSDWVRWTGGRDTVARTGDVFHQRGCSGAVWRGAE